MVSKKKGLRLCVVVLWMGTASSTFAAGFQLQEQNAAGLGMAYAGVGSIAADASTAYYNPAGLVRMDQEQVVFSAVGVFPNAKLTPSLATNNVGVPIALHSTKARGESLIPGFYYAKRLSDCWVFGFSAAAPFGLKTKYSRHSTARYLATRSELRTVDLTPSLAVDVGCGWSLAAGVDFLYTFAKLDSRIGATSPSPLGPITLIDGFQENTADGWGVGWNVGLLYELCDSTRFGLHYRSKMKVTVKGESIARLPSVPLILGGLLQPETEQRVRATVTFPETALLSIYHDFCCEWAMAADLRWTRWERFKQLTLRYKNLEPLLLAGNTLTTPEQYKNTYRAALGVIRTFNECWKLKVGTAYDRSPVHQKYRTARIPDSNRIWVGLGAQYRINECMVLDAAYAHLFFKKSHLDERAPLLFNGLPSSAAHLKGKYRSHADLFGLQFTWDIG